ncbi:MAG: flagellar hook-basal body complex protein FliE [Halieaceae bacterium]
MSDVSIDTVLAQMRALSETAKGGSATETSPAAGPEFSRLLQESLSQVNELQSTATEMKSAFTNGAENISLPEVMVAAQKASVSFEAVTQVRNKLLSAYKEIMSMQV